MRGLENTSRHPGSASLAGPHLHAHSTPLQKPATNTAAVSMSDVRGAPAPIAAAADGWSAGPHISRCVAQIDFGIVEENAGENKLHLRRVSQGMTIHVPQGEPQHPSPMTQPRP